MSDVLLETLLSLLETLLKTPKCSPSLSKKPLFREKSDAEIRRPGRDGFLSPSQFQTAHPTSSSLSLCLSAMHRSMVWVSSSKPTPRFLTRPRGQAKIGLRFDTSVIVLIVCNCWETSLLIATFYGQSAQRIGQAILNAKKLRWSNVGVPLKLQVTLWAGYDNLFWPTRFYPGLVDFLPDDPFEVAVQLLFEIRAAVQQHFEVFKVPAAFGLVHNVHEAFRLLVGDKNVERNLETEFLFDDVDRSVNGITVSELEVNAVRRQAVANDGPRYSKVIGDNISHKIFHFFDKLGFFTTYWHHFCYDRNLTKTWTLKQSQQFIFLKKDWRTFVKGLKHW